MLFRNLTRMTPRRPTSPQFTHLQHVMGSVAHLPYWQQNLPPALWPTTCPLFLQNLSAKDVSILSTPDAAYHVLSWADVRDVIARNRIDLFQRRPSELRRYLEFNWQCKQAYGSVMAYVLSQKLGWTLPLVPRADRPFACLEDLSVKRNDWPYGIDDRIVHLIVWTKFELQDDLESGFLTEPAKAEIDTYVKDVFVSRMGEENVIWFKNWKSLKSIHAVEHFHVMLYDPDPAFVDEITGDNVPPCKES